MIPNIYQGNYNRLAILPILLLVAAAFFIPQIKLGVDFTGGTLIVLELNSPVDAEQLRLSLENEGIIGTVKTYTTPFGEKAEIEIGQNPDLAQADTLRDQFNAQIQNVSILEAESAYNSSYLPEYLEERAKLNNISNSLFLLAGETANASSYDNLNILSSDSLSAYRQVYDNYKNIISKSLNKYADFSSFSIETVTPALGAHFIDRALGVVIWVALLSIIFVFLFFRSLIPSIAVIIGAFCDIFISLGAMGLFGIPLTLASFAALLMLLGFSLDTDVLLTMRLLKRKG
ncbi:hypothetical protein KJ780_02250, partial [Candidatus Micrarchaeota archaeon]|nr:hypothetical protein [Candidatus Micrarchaeota archaeon]